MKVDQVRDIVTWALEHLDDNSVRVQPIGNSVHLYAGDDEFEIVIRTMDPKGSSRLARKSPSP